MNQIVQDDRRAKKGDPSLIIAAGIFGWPLPGQEPTARYQIAGNGGTSAIAAGLPVGQRQRHPRDPGEEVRGVLPQPQHLQHLPERLPRRRAPIAQKIRATVGLIPASPRRWWTSTR